MCLAGLQAGAAQLPAKTLIVVYGPQSKDYGTYIFLMMNTMFSNLYDFNSNHISARIKHLQLYKEELLAILAVSSDNQSDDDEDSIFLTLTTAS